MTWPLVPKYSPSSDSTLTEWKDATDSSKLLDTVGAAITNGATVGTFNTSGGTARAYTQWGALARPTWVTGVANGLAGVHCNSQILATKTVTGFGSMTWQAGVMAAKFVSGTGACLGDSMTDLLVTLQPTISMIQARSQSIYAVGGRRLGTDAATAFATGNSIPASNVHITGWIIDYTNAKITLIESGVIGVRQQTFQTGGSTAAGEPYALGIGGFPQQNGAVFTNGAPGDHYFLESLRWTNNTAGSTAYTPDDLVAPQTYMRLKFAVN